MPVRNVFANGHLGVAFFFVLSGFVLGYNYLHGEKALRERRAEFWAARLARIYPLYFLGWALCLPDILATRLATDASTAMAKVLAAGAVNLALAQAWIPAAALSWNFPGWSVSSEAFFYAVFPFVGPLLLRLSHRARWASTLLLVVVSGAIRFALYRTGAPLEPHLGRLPPLFLVQFWIGIVLAIEAPRLERLFGPAVRFLVLSGVGLLIALPPEWVRVLDAMGITTCVFAAGIFALRTPGRVVSAVLGNGAAVALTGVSLVLARTIDVRARAWVRDAALRLFSRQRAPEAVGGGGATH